MSTPEAAPGTVLIVDDDEAIRDALSLLMNAAGLRCQCFASGPEFLAAVPPAGPACLLLDLRMPEMTGIEVQERLQATNPLLPIVFLTAHGDVPAAVTAVRHGALDFFEKPSFSQEVLLTRIRSAIELHRQRLSEEARQQQLSARIRQLSPREHEVARLAATGHANKVIAAELGISERTVEVHRGRAMKKLALRSIAELALVRGALERPDERSPNAHGSQ